MYVSWMVGAPRGSQCAGVGKMVLINEGISPLCAYLPGELMLFISSGNSHFPYLFGSGKVNWVQLQVRSGHFP